MDSVKDTKAPKEWRDLFVGREAELNRLEVCWTAARGGKPQLAVLLAPPGIGKTRLVQQFYQKLSHTHDGLGDQGYWPDRLGRERDRIALSCRPDECSPENPMTMMWWAIKCVDTGHNGAASSDLLLAYKEFLEPHLVLRRTDAQLHLLRTEQMKEAAKGFGEAMIAGAEKASELIPVVGPFIGLGKALGMTILDKARKIRSLEQQRSELEAGRLDVSGKMRAEQADFEDRLIAGLEEIFSPKRKNVAPCPMVVVVDDAQFADQEPALASFLRRLIDTAWERSWPLLVIMTHWTSEWNERAGDIALLPGLITSTVREGLIEANIITLGKIDGLAEVLTAAIPDLPTAQSTALLSKASGNARYLDRLIQLLLASPAMFITRAPHGPLHPDALDELLKESFDLHDITRRLFDSAPEDARRAAALASIQGERFLHGLIDEILSKLGHSPLENGLQYCENPLAVMGSAGSGIGEFSQGVFREVARTMVPRLVDRESVVLRTLEQLFKTRLDNWVLARSMDVSSNSVVDALLLDLIIGLAENQASSESWEILGRRASVWKGDLLREQGDMLGSTEIFAPLIKAMEEDGEIAGIFRAYELLAITNWCTTTGRFQDCRKILNVAVDLFPNPRQADVNSKFEYGLIQSQVGNFLLMTETPRRALPHIRDALTAIRECADVMDTAFARRRLAYNLSLMANVTLEIEGAKSALVFAEEDEQISNDLVGELSSVYFRRNSGFSLKNMGDLLKQAGDYQAAAAKTRACIAVRSALVEELNLPDDLSALAITHCLLGDLVAATDGPAAALPHYQEYARIQASVLELLDTPMMRRDYGVAQNRLGDMVSKIDGPEAALPYYREFARISAALAVELDTPDARRVHAVAQSRLGDMLLALEGASAALPHFQEDCRIFSQLVQEIDTVWVREDYSKSLTSHKNALLQLDQLETAVPILRELAATYQRLISDNSTLQARADYAAALRELSEVLLKTEGPRAALPAAAAYVDISGALAQEVGTVDIARSHAGSLQTLGSIHLRLGDPHQGRASLRQAADISETLARETHTADNHILHGALKTQLGEASCALGEIDDAARHYQQSAKVFADLVATLDPEEERVYVAYAHNAVLLNNFQSHLLEMARHVPTSPPAEDGREFPEAIPALMTGSWHDLTEALVRQLGHALSEQEILSALQIEREAIVTARIRRLPFWENRFWVDICMSAPDSGPRVLPVLIGSTGIRRINGTSAVIHQINQKESPNIETPELAREYLRFFCGAVHNPEAGPFHIIETTERYEELTGAAFPLDDFSERPLQIALPSENHISDLRAMVLNGATLYLAKFSIARDGDVAMTGDRVLKSDLPLSFGKLNGAFLTPRPK